MKLLWVAAFLVIQIGAARSWAFPVEVSYAPANDLALTIEAIQNARQSILLNIYDLSSPQVAGALMDRIKAGVHVEILEEGQPVGGMSAAARSIEAELVQAMRSMPQAGDHFFEMHSQQGQARRFHFDHAKYIVIDNSALLIGSENYSPTGNPLPGALGNRGWEVILHDPAISQEYAQVFQADATTQAGDVIDRTATGVNFQGVVQLPHVPKAPQGVLVQAAKVYRATAPDLSLKGLLAMIQVAKKSIDVQQMTFDSRWSTGNGRNPLVDALMAAASRGVQVRVLMNDENAFGHGNNQPAGTDPSSNPKNVPTMNLINAAAKKAKLPIEARIANVHAMGVDYIHNKGMIVDGHLTLVSSINWDENAIMHNREGAVIIDGAQPAAYYEKLFSNDWNVSASKLAP